MIKHYYYILKLLRPRQWIKNFALFTALVFGGQLFEIGPLIQVFLGFISFCLLVSSTYIINDILDLKKDRLHPFKKARPIASDKVSFREATIIFIAILALALFIARGVGDGFFLISLLYLALQISYLLHQLLFSIRSLRSLKILKVQD